MGACVRVACTGTTSFLLGEQKPGPSGVGITVVALDDAPEGGKCHP
jgi:hypothetical protein